MLTAKSSEDNKCRVSYDLSALETGSSQLMPEQFDFVEFLETIAGRLLDYGVKNVSNGVLFYFSIPTVK